MPAARADEILTNFGLRKEGADGWLIPSHRQDLSREADLIEEITRAFGIENIPGHGARAICRGQSRRCRA